jgi:hypothetical protein
MDSASPEKSRPGEAMAESAGINRSEGGDERALRERSNEPLGPEFGVVDAARQPTKHKTGDGWAGY